MIRKYYKVDNRRSFYAERIIIQDGKCNLCGRSERLFIDHNPKTGIMRSLLCYRHKMALRGFEDNPSLLRDAAKYVERHETDNEIENIPNFVIEEDLKTLVNDLTFPSLRSKARALANKVGIKESSAYTKLRRFIDKRNTQTVTSTAHNALIDGETR